MATTSVPSSPPFSAAEFFAGIGLVRLALGSSGFRVSWANDIEPVKAAMYADNFGPRDYRLGDVREVRGADLPEVDLATASFPCTDLSLAGYRRGLSGNESSMFWEFARVLREMKKRRPSVVMLENVPGFATSHGGRDIHMVLAELNSLGYSCDIMQIDAARFVPQSRPRMFIVGAQEPPQPQSEVTDWARPRAIEDIYRANSDLRLHRFPLPEPAGEAPGLASVVERIGPSANHWWDESRTSRFVQSLSPIHAERLASLIESPRMMWRTAYRRTRSGKATWEIRRDEIAGCLRTARGGSSKQALVEAGQGSLRLRWMTPREYARLQGVPDEFSIDSVTETQAMSGFGDAVCVPVVEWIARHYLAQAVGSTRQVPALSA